MRLIVTGYAAETVRYRFLWGQKNLHLAVRPKAGARAVARSVYGPVFVIEGAEEIAIRGPVVGEGLAGRLSEEHARCKNFRFGWQVYGDGDCTSLAEPIS